MSKRIALTFDDGPIQGVTNEVLDILKQYSVRATFFVVGRNVAANPGLVKRAVDEGHLLGNHTYTHGPWDASVTSETLKKDELEKTNEAITTALKPREYVPRFFRAPRGDYFQRLADAADGLGFVMVNGKYHIPWDIDDGDWNSDITAEAAAKTIQDFFTARTEDGIVLCHDHWSNDPAAMAIVIPKLQGWTFVTIDEFYGCKDTLRAGEYLIPGQCIQSENDAYRLIYQADGNLVLYQTSDGKALWATQPTAVFTCPAWRFYMQGDDGNIVVYQSEGVPVWASNIYGPQYARSNLVLLGNGNLEVHDKDNNTIWRAIYGSGIWPTPPQTTPGV